MNWELPRMHSEACLPGHSHQPASLGFWLLPCSCNGSKFETQQLWQTLPGDWSPLEISRKLPGLWRWCQVSERSQLRGTEQVPWLSMRRRRLIVRGLGARGNTHLISVSSGWGLCGTIQSSGTILPVAGKEVLLARIGEKIRGIF